MVNACIQVSHFLFSETQIECVELVEYQTELETSIKLDPELCQEPDSKTTSLRKFGIC